MAFMTWCLFINMPLIYIYGRGSVWTTQSGITQTLLGRQTLGNLGESSVNCFQKDVLEEDPNWFLACPEGSTIKKLTAYGLQKFDTSPKDYICPQNNNLGSYIDLDIDEKCSYSKL